MRNDTFDTARIYDWGWGMPLYLKHNQIKLPLDASKGDLVQFWDGDDWQDMDLPDGTTSEFKIEAEKGVLYLRGWFLSYFRKNKFRITYRYGSSQEGELVPETIKEACILLTAMKIINTDFKMSLVPYAEEGKVEKTRLLGIWGKEVNKIMSMYKEIQTIW
jgi:hypothetical protein